MGAGGAHIAHPTSVSLISPSNSSNWRAMWKLSALFFVVGIAACSSGPGRCVGAECATGGGSELGGGSGGGSNATGGGFASGGGSATGGGAGGGSVATGGGSGTDGGSGVICNPFSGSNSCLSLPTIIPSASLYFVGHGSNADRVRFFLPTSNLDAGTFDHLTIERWSTGGPTPTLPINYSVVPMTYDSCANCVFIRRGCALANLADGGLTLACEKMFLAQSGTLKFDKIGNGIEGEMAGSGCNLHFVQWDFRRADDGSLVADQAVDGGECLDLLGYRYNLTYTDYGQSFDAGQ